MTDKAKPPSSTRIAAIIKHYEDMAAADIEAELASQGIDARKTVDAVTKLVNDKLDEWRRGGLHQEETVKTACAGTPTCSRPAQAVPPAQAFMRWIAPHHEPLPAPYVLINARFNN